MSPHGVIKFPKNIDGLDLFHPEMGCSTYLHFYFKVRIYASRSPMVASGMDDTSPAGMNEVDPT